MITVRIYDKHYTVLPEDDPFAFENVFCSTCRIQVHAPNRQMKPWCDVSFDTQEAQVLCADCFKKWWRIQEKAMR